jgi:DNA helicase HerA-like ATPase
MDNPGTPSLAARRRRIVEQLAIESTAFSLDGRTFDYEAPLTQSMPAGEFVEIRTADDRTYLGQVLDAGVVERAGPAIGVEGDAGLDLAGADNRISTMTFNLRLRHVQGTGTLLGRVTGNGVQPPTGNDRFDDATIATATPEIVAATLRDATLGKTTLPIGTLTGLEPPPPAALLASGFGRHTFMVGQSGSGKTYSLGVILERLLLDTDLRIVIVDPNSDYVRLGDLRDDADPEIAARYREIAPHIRVVRPANRAEPGEPVLRLWFSELSTEVQTLVLQLNPLTDRDEFGAFMTIVQQLGGAHYSLRDVQEVAGRSLSAESRQLALRIAALRVSDWEIWAHGDDPLLGDQVRDCRALVFDVGGFRRAEEKSLVANGLLGLLWHGRDQRQPCLVVIDEAHNICPQEPDEPIQAMATQRAIAIAAEGRKYGLYLLLSTQRPGKIHINILSQCDNLVLMRMNSADDLQRLAQVFSFVPSTLLDRSTTFAQGESLVAGKISPLPAIIRFGKRFSQEGGSDIPDTWTRPS